jgi:SEL1 protein
MGNLALRRLLLLLLLLFLSISAPPSLDAARRNQRKIVLIFADDQATRRPSSQEKLLNTDSVLPQSAQERKSASLERRKDEEEEEEEEEEDFKDFDDLNPKDLDPGSWKTIAEDYANIEGRKDSGVYSFPMSMASEDLLYIEGVRKMLDSASYGDPDTLSDAVSRIREAAEDGHAHAQSTMAFLYGNGIGVEHSDAKAFLYHYFAAEGGNFQSKLALAYGYFRQQVFCFSHSFVYLR